MAKWKVIFYLAGSSSNPIGDFIDSLSERAQAKVIHSVHLLKEYGVQLSGSHTKQLTGTPFWELRILGSDNIRIVYVAVEQRTFLFLNGFIKKSKKTPTKEINSTYAEPRCLQTNLPGVQKCFYLTKM